MSTPRLSPSSYLVLGMVSLLGRPTTYEINRQVGYTVGQFWSFPASQLYAETARLAKAGLLTEEREEGGRHRRYYTITGRGREALGDWLVDPTSPPPELRHGGLLKLFFSELITTDELVALAKTQEAWHREQLAQYQAVMDRYGNRPELARRIAAGRLCWEQAQTWVDFWADIAANPPPAVSRQPETGADAPPD